LLLLVGCGDRSRFPLLLPALGFASEELRIEKKKNTNNYLQAEEEASSFYIASTEQERKALFDEFRTSQGWIEHIERRRRRFLKAIRRKIGYYSALSSIHPFFLTDEGPWSGHGCLK
jgi:hypothetical protein